MSAIATHRKCFSEFRWRTRIYSSKLSISNRITPDYADAWWSGVPSLVSSGFFTVERASQGTPMGVPPVPRATVPIDLYSWFGALPVTPVARADTQCHGTVYLYSSSYRDTYSEVWGTQSLVRNIRSVMWDDFRPIAPAAGTVRSTPDHRLGVQRGRIFPPGRTDHRITPVRLSFGLFTDAEHQFGPGVRPRVVSLRRPPTGSLDWWVWQGEKLSVHADCVLLRCRQHKIHILLWIATRYEVLPATRR